MIFKTAIVQIARELKVNVSALESPFNRNGWLRLLPEAFVNYWWRLPLCSFSYSRMNGSYSEAVKLTRLGELAIKFYKNRLIEIIYKLTD